jgi:Cu/Zn superoxide dismutase
MTKMIAAALGLGAALIVAATAQSPAPAPARKMPQQLHLVAQNNSGETGTATLYDGAKGLIVKLRTSGSESVDQPAHIHKGTCDKLDPKPTYPLKPVHDGQSETTVEGVTIAQLQKAPYAINVHKSAKEAAVYVACGNLVAPK